MTSHPVPEHVGASHLRKLNGKALETLKQTLVVCNGPKPVAVILPYALYLAIQKQLQNGV